MEKNIKIRSWILDLPKRGQNTFSIDEIYGQYPAYNKRTVASALWRLVESGKIQSVWKGFYVVIPVEYELRGSVPPILYIDRLMNYLQRDYYVGLLNAAAFHGAAHQQPQEFTVITDKQNFRDKFKNGVKINFVSKKNIPYAYLKPITTKTGYVTVSNPELTAMDLIFYQKEIGGLSRAGTILDELAEIMDFVSVNDDFFKYFPAPVIQRLGYLMDEILDYGEQAKILLEKAMQAGVKFRHVLLKPESGSRYEATSKTWKIWINEKIEIDD